MLENLNGWEFAVLLLLALLIFGERLPKVLGDAMRMLRQLRTMAMNATSDLSKDLGTDIKLEDLNPKTFVRKHLLSEEEEAELRKPLEGLYRDVRQEADALRSVAGQAKSELSATAKAVKPSVKPAGSAGLAPGAARGGAVAEAPAGDPITFDDAT